MRRRSILLSLFVVFLGASGCKKDAPEVANATDAGVSAVTIASASAATATDAGAATTAPVTHEQQKAEFHGFFGKSANGAAFWLGLRRRGDTVYGMYRASASTDFVGRMTDATHFSMHESHVPKGETPATLVGEVPADTALVATMTDGRTQKKTQLTSKGDVFDASSQSFKQEYTGSLGGRFIRMKLEKSGDKLTGVYRYAKSAEDINLSGTANDKTGAFEITEKVGAKVTGHFAGVFVSKSGALAEWSSPDGERRFNVTLTEGGGYPETVDVGQGMKLYPQENVIDGKRCKSDIVFPQLRGAKDATKQAALNAQLGGAEATERTCVGPGPEEPDAMDYETNTSYSLGTQKPGRFIGISQGGYSYMGGAHGNTASTCVVIDTKNLTQLRLAELLTEAGRKKLGELATHAFEKARGVTKLTDANFFEDTVEIQKTTNLCLSDNEIEVSFNPYDVAPYVEGFQTASFPKADLKDLFERNETTDALFQP